MVRAMFWINAMGFHIWRLFNIGGSKKPFREDLKKFLFYALYAQGVPLLINVVTAIVDSSNPAKTTKHYPNMGEFRCFLGDPTGEAKEMKAEYYESAKFIYNDLFMFLIQLVNGAFLISIGIVLKRGWADQAERLKLTGWGCCQLLKHIQFFRDVEQKMKERFLNAASNGIVVLRLFVILGTFLHSNQTNPYIPLNQVFRGRLS